MDQVQIEVGWWHGTDAHPYPPYYAFTYPRPDKFADVKIKLGKAHWDEATGEFLLDYDDIRCSKHPEKDLFVFFESTYRAGAARAH